MPRFLHRGPFVGVLAVLLVAAAACGDDAEPSADSAATSTTAVGRGPRPGERERGPGARPPGPADRADGGRGQLGHRSRPDRRGRDQRGRWGQRRAGRPGRARRRRRSGRDVDGDGPAHRVRRRGRPPGPCHLALHLVDHRQDPHRRCPDLRRVGHCGRPVDRRQRGVLLPHGAARPVPGPRPGRVGPARRPHQRRHHRPQRLLRRRPGRVRGGGVGRRRGVALRRHRAGSRRTLALLRTAIISAVLIGLAWRLGG